MRNGVNPGKQEEDVKVSSIHRVIVPIYIPNLENYFKNGLEILELCLGSLKKTVSKNTKVTIIDNNCCAEVKKYILHQFDEGWIDQLVVNKENLGKIDPIMAVVRSCSEQWITFSDCDVLFCNGWVQETFKIFSTFKKAGFISKTPDPVSHRIYYSSTILGTLFNRNTFFRKSIDPIGIKMFDDSRGLKKPFLNDTRINWTLTIRKNNFEAILGGGHFVATIHKNSIRNAPKENSNKKILGGSENKYLDIPNDKAGYWRLSTTKAYCYHLGNVYEPWMKEKFEKISPDNHFEFQEPKPPIKNFLKIPFFLRQYISIHLTSGRLWKYYYAFKKLPKNLHKNFRY